MDRLQKIAILIACILSTGAIYAQGGTCPTAAKYLNPSTGSLVTLSSLGVTSCFYISKAIGSDTNAGTSKTSSWAHMPGMPSCTGTCSKLTPKAGEGFILRGGDTWISTDLDLYWQWTGTSSSPFYIGVDQDWYNPSCGDSWCRPKFTCGGASCSYTSNGNGFYTDQSGIQYVTVDNIEWTGLYQSTASYPNYFSIYGSYNTFVHNYIHGWSHAAASTGAQDNSKAFAPSTCCGGGIGNVFLYDIVDGSDTTKDMLLAFGGDPAEIGYSVINYVTNGIEGSQNIVHDTLIENIVLCFLTEACHQNAILQARTSSGSTALFYNNVITGVVSGGMPKLWLGQATGGNPQTVYAFNNVIFNNAAGNDINPCQLNSGSCGTYYYFNNTFECGNSSGLGPCMAASGTLAPTEVAYWINNHCIATACVSITGDANITYTETTDLVQSVTTARNQGLTYSSDNISFQPTISSSETVGKGTNLQSLCKTIAGLNPAAGVACQSDTGYACTYNTSDHTISLGTRRTVKARPSTSAWDIGAYQFTNAPQPPTNVTGTHVP
jgi:hypothetical protein